MGSRFSYKAEEVMPIYVNQSFDYNAINNLDPVFPKEEANDKTKEDEVHIPVEEQQEKDQVKKQEEENDEDAEDEVKIEVEKKEEEGNQEGSSKETEASRDSHRARLLSNAEKCGLRLRYDVQGDGNCYFRALADQLARIGLLESVKTTSHEDLRAEICDYMQDNPIPEMIHHVTTEYISNMRQNHQWAGEPEIVATMKKYGVNMKVVTSAACSTANGFYMHDFQEKNATETLYLGHIHEKHYVSLEPVDDQEQRLTKDLGDSSPAMSSAATNQVERPVTQQEHWRVHMEGMMLHQEQWRVHMEGMMLHQEQWRVHMEGMMLHQEIQTLTPAPPDQVTKQEEGNDDEIEDEVKTEVEEQQKEGEPPTKSCCCRMTSALYAFAYLVYGCVAIGLYIFCFFGDNEYYLQFFGHMSYRPSLVLAPLIIFVAAFKAPEDPYTSWANVFVLSKLSWKAKFKAFKNNKLCWSLCSTVVIYMLVPYLVLAFRVVFNFTAPKQCQGIIWRVWLGTELVGVLSFSYFCWFLYLQRLVVQEASMKASRLMCHIESQFGDCISSITTFFKEYYPLRSLMLPLVYIFLFESIFGIGSFLTWHYQNGNPSNGTSYTTIQPNWTETPDGCPINCPALDFNHLKSSVIYNLWIVSRHIMIILLPYWSASGMDMKYIWDDVMTKFTYSYSEDHESGRKVTAYMKRLHPKTSTYTVLTITVPLLALVAGIFTGNQF